MSAEFNSDDLDRGRTTAMIAALGRVQLTLDLIERRLGRVEDAVLEIGESLAAEREAGLVPAELPYTEAIEEPVEDAAGFTGSGESA